MAKQKKPTVKKKKNKTTRLKAKLKRKRTKQVLRATRGERKTSH